jgi:predicted Na+-dependent transporter
VVRERRFNMTAYLGIALGVLVAIVYPVLRGFVTKEFQPTAAPGLPPWVKKYGGLLLFSLVTALIVLAVYNSQNSGTDLTFLKAFLLGIGWEAIVEKAYRKPLPDAGG